VAVLEGLEAAPLVELKLQALHHSELAAQSSRLALEPRIAGDLKHLLADVLEDVETAPLVELKLQQALHDPTPALKERRAKPVQRRELESQVDAPVLLE
jgi:hypothetical protein